MMSRTDKGVNVFGLDVHYFEGKLLRVVRDIRNYTPEELARELARLSRTADNRIMSESEFKSD